MTTVNKHKILKNLPIFLSAGLILAAGFVFVHFSAKNKNPGQGEVLGQNTLGGKTGLQSNFFEQTIIKPLYAFNQK